MDRLQILRVARSELMPDASVKNHTHPYYHMLHVQTGIFRLITGGNTYELKPGHTLLVPPQVEHGYTNATQVHGEYLEIKFAIAQRFSDEVRVQTSDNPL